MAFSALEAANGACGDRTLIVVGHESSAVAAACKGLPGFVAVNDNYREGMGTSIAAAVTRLPPGADAALIVLADQPLVTAEHLRALIGAWSGEEDEIVASGFAGTQGPPALFPRGCYPLLAGLRGDKGARSLMRDPRVTVTIVDFEPAAIDIDTPEDIRRS